MYPGFFDIFHKKPYVNLRLKNPKIPVDNPAGYIIFLKKGGNCEICNPKSKKCKCHH